MSLSASLPAPRRFFLADNPSVWIFLLCLAAFTLWAL